jgi:hypothetical protein
MAASTVVPFTRVCAQCKTAKPADDFIGRRGGVVTYCSACRTRYYGGAPHVSGKANVGARGSRARLRLGARARTENVRQMPKRHLHLVEAVDPARPRTRGDCAAVARPCPWISCRHNLFLDVDPRNGSIKYNWPDREPDEVEPDRSCALDVADLGGGTLEDIAVLTNVTRERIRQVQSKALSHVRRRGGVLSDFVEGDSGAEAPLSARADGERSVFEGRISEPESDGADGADDEADVPTRVSFFAGDDDIVCASVWTMFVKDSNGRGFAVAAKDAKAQRRVPPPVPTAPVPTTTASGHVEREDTMEKAKKRGEMLDTTLEAYRAFEAKHGRAPGTKELFDALGPAVGKTVSNVGQAVRRLVKQGRLKANGAASPARVNGHARPLPGPRQAPATTRANGHSRPAPRTTNGVASDDVLLASLVAKRDFHADKVAALQIAIDALGGA